MKNIDQNINTELDSKTRKLVQNHGHGSVENRIEYVAIYLGS